MPTLFDQIESMSDPLLSLYEQYTASVIQDIARRLKALGMTDASAWQMQRLIESGKTYEFALEKIARLTQKSDAELRKLFREAGVRAVAFDDKVYRAAGLTPQPLHLSPAMAQVLAAGLRKTSGVMHNLTMTTAISAQSSFIGAADLAYMQVSSGAMSYTEAIRYAIKSAASKGLPVIYYSSGHRDQLDVAMRRTVLTGVSQTAGNLQMARAREMGVEHVAVSAHAGARNTGAGHRNHESWQGKVYRLVGFDTEYQNFEEVTGYGTVDGIYGANCRHTTYPWYEGISRQMYSQSELESMSSQTVDYNDKTMSVYEATQVQREIERKIRYWKRQGGALDAARLDTEYEQGKVKHWQGRMRDFIQQMNRQYEPRGIRWHRQYERE